MWPVFCFCMCGRAAATPYRSPLMLTSICRSHSSTLRASMGAMGIIPALLTITSTRPRLSTAFSKRAEVESLIQKAVDSLGRVDVIVNNAGIMPIAPIEALKVDEWDRQIDVNIKGLLYGVAAALPHMQKQKSGHIINIASVFGIKMFAPGGTVYCATKAAVRALTEGLRMELHSQNIRCTMISPGAIATELAESSSDEATRKNLREFMKMAIPASSIARAIAYAIEQPVEVEVDEMVIRPTVQDF